MCEGEYLSLTVVIIMHLTFRCWHPRTDVKWWAMSHSSDFCQWLMKRWGQMNFSAPVGNRNCTSCPSWNCVLLFPRLFSSHRPFSWLRRTWWDGVQEYVKCFDMSREDAQVWNKWSNQLTQIHVELCPLNQRMRVCFRHRDAAQSQRLRTSDLGCQTVNEALSSRWLICFILCVVVCRDYKASRVQNCHRETLAFFSDHGPSQKIAVIMLCASSSTLLVCKTQSTLIDPYPYICVKNQWQIATIKTEIKMRNEKWCVVNFNMSPCITS